MNKASVLRIIALLIFAVLVLGCCAWISEFRSGSGDGEPHSFRLTNNSHIIFLDLNLTKSGTVWVYVVSDYSLDILVMDRGNFTSYYATEQGNLTQWGAYATKVNVTAGGLNYTAPIDGYYLFIIDNTPLNAGGAPGDRTANFSVSYAYQWNHYPAPLSWLQGN